VSGLDVLDARLIAERLATDLRQAERHLIDHVGHYPNLEDPTRFNELALAFVDEIL
jgi:pimeloyl-ACP methyl ester carboxylesterase